MSMETRFPVNIPTNVDDMRMQNAVLPSHRFQAFKKCAAKVNATVDYYEAIILAHVCSDHFTNKVDSENRCTSDEDCEGDGMKGVCDGGHCCPIGRILCRNKNSRFQFCKKPSKTFHKTIQLN